MKKATLKLLADEQVVEAYSKQVLRRFLRDLISGEDVGASDGKRYGVSWLANYKAELVDSYGLKIKSVPRGVGLKHRYIIQNMEKAIKVLKSLEKSPKSQP